MSASYGGQVVRKVNPANEVSDFVKSTGRWSPIGGVFDPDGNLWLMEVSLVNEVRVQKIEGSKTGDLRKNGFPQLLVQLKIALGVIVLVLVYRWFSKKRKPA